MIKENIHLETSIRVTIDGLLVIGVLFQTREVNFWLRETIFWVVESCINLKGITYSNFSFF